MFSLLLSLLLNAPSAHAACPWEGETVKVSAIFGVVYVNGAPYRVRRQDDVDEFAEILSSCNADRAAEQLDNWKVSRAVTLTMPMVSRYLPIVGLAGLAGSIIVDLRSQNIILRDIRYGAEAMREKERSPDPDDAAQPLGEEEAEAVSWTLDSRP